MRCYQHPERESVGICVNCGKAGCQQCVHALKSGLRCSGCVRQAVTKMWLKIGISVLFGVAGAVGGYYMALTSKRVTPTLLFNETVVFAYAAWATFWGWGRVWRIWRHVLNGLSEIGCAVNVFLLPLVLYLFIAIPFSLAACYGMFGGSILELVLVLIPAFQLSKRLQPAGQQQGDSQQLAAQQNQSWQPPFTPFPQQHWGTQQNQNWPQPFAPQFWGPQATGQQYWEGQQNQNWQPPLPQQQPFQARPQQYPPAPPPQQPFTPQFWGPQATGQQYWEGQQPPVQRG